MNGWAALVELLLGEYEEEEVGRRTRVELDDDDDGLTRIYFTTTC